jgi:hypothetical protein
MKTFFDKAEIEREAVLKTYELFMYADIEYTINLLCENVLKMASP